MNANQEVVNNQNPSMSGDDFPDMPVPQSHRVTWKPLTFVWFGAAMVAQLYQCGVTIGTGMGSLSLALEAIFWGTLFLAMFVGLNGVIGQATGCNAALSGTYAYGSKGVVIPGFHIADIGWFVVMIAIFASIMNTIIPWIDIRVFCILFCYLFMTNGYIGFNQMVILNKFAFPILALVSLYGLYQVNSLPGGIPGLFDKVFANNFTMAAAITAIIGTWSAGASRAADYFRFAKSGKDTLIASFMGFFGGFILCIGCGAIWGAASGSTDIGITLIALNMVLLGSIMFFVQTWTTGEHSAYITSTALPLSIGIITGKKIHRRYIILSVGLIGITIGGMNIQNYYVPFISFLGYVIPVIGAIVMTDYFIMSKTNYHWSGHTNFYSIPVNSEDVQHHIFNPATVPALIIGMLISWQVPWGIPALNGLVGTAIVYILFCMAFHAAGMYRKEAKRNSVFAKKEA